MARGVIKRFNINGGFGFISPLDSPGGKDADLFFHVSNCLTDEHNLQAGVLVDYDVAMGNDKPMAVDIVVRPKLAGEIVRGVIAGDIFID